MKKRILAGLLSIACACSVFTTAFANETVENVAAAEETLVAAGEARTSNEAGQVYTIPILRDKKDSSPDPAAASARPNTASLMSESSRPVIQSAYSEDFYADADTFRIQLYMGENMGDTRQQLKLAVVDANDVVIAEQVGVYYRQSGLVYQMKLVKSVDAYSQYSIRFTYNGEHGELEYDISSAYIRPITKVDIKNVEVINRASNSFKIELANAAVGTEYTLFYVDNTGASAKKDATVASDKALYAEFGNGTMFSRYNKIWLCPYGATNYSYSNCIDYSYLSDFDIQEVDGERASYGVTCSDYISTNDSFVWAYMYCNSLDQSYEASDAANADIYMFDTTTGKTVGTTTETEFEAEYGQIRAKVTLNTKLDETHKYILVVNDGYDLRIYDDFTVTSKTTLASVFALYTYDHKTYYSTEKLSAGSTSFYVYADSYNISDRSGIKVELLDSSGKAVATSTYTDGYHLMTATTPLAVGKYTLKATYGALTASKTITVSEGSTSAWQLVQGCTVFNGKTYIMAALQTTTLNPQNLTYKVVLADGTEKTATYHRALTAKYIEKHFVVVVDEALTDISSSNEAKLKMYDGTNFIAPTYDDYVTISWINKTEEPFVYDEKNITETSVEIFLEGFSDVGTFTLCAYDELTGTGVTVPAAKSSNTSVTFNKSDLKKINRFYEISSGYSSFDLFLENNGAYLTRIYTSPHEGIINARVKESFSFRKRYTEDLYEVLNLPHNTYAYYKVAGSESELASKAYQAMDVGVLYQLKDQPGEQTVYARFKTADGVESAVQTASITVDTEAPVFSILGSVPSTLMIDEYSNLLLEFNVSTSEAGKIYFAFYDKDGYQISYDYVNVAAGTQTVSRSFWASSTYNYESAVKLVIYMTDFAGHKSEEFSFDVSVVQEFSEYRSGATYLKIDNKTGTIVAARSTGTTIRIPSEINGVAVTAIEAWAFEDNGKSLRISIPASVTSIDEDAFWGLYDYTLFVKKNSTAYRFAVANDIPYEIVTYMMGDLNGDDVLNAKDVTLLRRYIAGGYNMLIANATGTDITKDGTVNAKDITILRRAIVGSYGVELI